MFPIRKFIIRFYQHDSIKKNNNIYEGKGRRINYFIDQVMRENRD